MSHFYNANKLVYQTFSPTPYLSVETRHKMHGTSCLVQSYGSEGLQLVEHEETVSCGQAVLQLTFDPGVFGHTPITARCQLDHPFYVKNKGTSAGDEQCVSIKDIIIQALSLLSGWSSFYPSLTVVHYGIPCYEMEVGDMCLPPGHRDAKHTDDSLVFDTFRR